MFDIFDYLELHDWFQPPFDEFKEVAICRKSGFLASYVCDEIDTVEIPAKGIRTDPCPYHFTIHLDKQKKYRVNVNCENPKEIIHKAWFILPPAMEWYYKRKNPLYKPLPPYRFDCLENNEFQMMEFIYPKHSNKIYVPVELDGTQSETVFEVAHRNSSAILYWHLDEEYIGSTENIHQKGLQPDEGEHILTVVDNEGNSMSKKFLIVRSKE